MSPAEKAAISTLFVDAETGLQAIDALAELFGVTSTVIVSTLIAKLPQLAPGGPDEKAEYDAAKADASK